jgi:hypothetical protein
MGQSYGTAGNWTEAGLIGIDSSLARAIRGNEGSMDGCRPVLNMFDQPIIAGKFAPLGCGQRG